MFNIHINLQKLILELFRDIKEFIGEKVFCCMLLGLENENFGRIVTIKELIDQCDRNNSSSQSAGQGIFSSGPHNTNKGTPLGQLLVYTFDTLDSFKRTYECKAKVYGGLWSHHQLSQLSCLVMLLTFVFKLKLPLKLINDKGDQFEKDVGRIISDLLLILAQNEEFNEKYMEFRGSAVRANPAPTASTAPTPQEQQAQPNQKTAQPGTQSQPNTANSQNQANPNAMKTEPLSGDKLESKIINELVTQPQAQDPVSQS